MNDEASRPVVVDGAELFLGGAVVSALIRLGGPVRALVADGSSKVPEGAERAVAPLGDEEALKKALDGTRAAVAARKLSEEIPREGLTFQKVHAERTRALVAAAESAGAERFLHIGVAGIDRRRSGGLADAERLAEAYAVTSRIPALLLRASLVVGSGDGHVSRMAMRAAKRWPVLVFVGQGWARSAPICARDFGDCVAKALLADEFRTGVLSIGGPELLTAMDIQDRLLGRAGRNKLKLHVPESVAQAGAAVLEKILRRPPVTRARLSWLLEDLVPDRAASMELLGRKPERFEEAF